MGKVLFVASYKGGVGKTTVSAGISAALALQGKKVLVIDGDFHMRCMDLILNSESDFIFDALDVLLGRCTASEAIVSNCGEKFGINGLDFLPAPLIYDDTQPMLKNADILMEQLRDKYDYIVIDSGADTPGIYDAFAGYADEGIVVTFQQSTAIRAAEVTAGKISSLGLESIRLVVNSYRAKGAKLKILPDVFESVTRAGVPLLGVIPYDPKIIEYQEKGILPLAKKSLFIRPFEAAFGNIAKRIMGEKVPLFNGVGIFSLRKKYICCSDDTSSVCSSSQNEDGFEKNESAFSDNVESDKIKSSEDTEQEITSQTEKTEKIDSEKIDSIEENSKNEENIKDEENTKNEKYVSDTSDINLSTDEIENIEKENSSKQNESKSYEGVDCSESPEMKKESNQIPTPIDSDDFTGMNVDINSDDINSDDIDVTDKFIIEDNKNANNVKKHDKKKRRSGKK